MCFGYDINNEVRIFELDTSVSYQICENVVAFEWSNNSPWAGPLCLYHLGGGGGGANSDYYHSDYHCEGKQITHNSLCGQVACSKSLENSPKQFFFTVWYYNPRECYFSIAIIFWQTCFFFFQNFELEIFSFLRSFHQMVDQYGGCSEIMMQFPRI